LKKYISTLIAYALLFSINGNAQQLKNYNAAELQIALQKLNVLGSVLYVAAHPDDENTSLLAYFSKGRKYRTAYLSLNRGSGGQNLIGPEKGAEIGIIRTQELLSARGVDGAEQYFTRALDFGYSKTAEETLAIWGKEETLSDIVWVIRNFRPDVIITRFPSSRSSGHGHHTASGTLIQEAFHLAADPKKFQEQLKHVKPWQAKRLYWNSWRPGQAEIGRLLKVDIGEYNPLLGKSYSEMAAISRSMHRSQGFGVGARRGTRYDYFEHIAGDRATKDIFDGIDTSWNRLTDGRKTGRLLDSILKSFDPLQPSESLSALLGVYAELSTLDDTPWVKIKKEELLGVIQASAGLWIEAIADDFSAAQGDEAHVKTTIVNRSEHPFKVEKISFPQFGTDYVVNISLTENTPQSFDNTILIPKDHPISQPYWLKEDPQKGKSIVRNQEDRGRAENHPAIRVKISLRDQKNLLEYNVPLLYRWTERVDGEHYRPFEIRPLVTSKIEDKVSIFTRDEPKEINVRITSHAENISGKIRLKGSNKWHIEPAEIPFSLLGKYKETQVTFKVVPPKNSDQAELIAEAEIGGQRIDRAIVDISHPHIKRQVYFPQSRVKVVKLDIKRNGSKLGYIMGSGDEVSDGLSLLGYEVIQLDDSMLDNWGFSQFDAIITGIRAYNTRERLKVVQPKLLQYVKDGGTLIVQYNVSRGLLTKDIGPYPFTIGRERVSMENAPVQILNPDHPLLNFPNKITGKDFEEWIQERGLYFATQWDEHYEAILASHDANESDKGGGLLYTRYGKGVFIYTGYSWFRQLPAGVPGAFRILANLISAGKHD